MAFQPEGGEPEACGSGEWASPLAAEELEELRWYVEDYLSTPSAAWDDRGDEVRDRLESWGRSLFDAVFGEGRPGREAWSRAVQAGGWELWLCGSAPDVQALPWELLRDAEALEPLALDLEVIARCEVAPTSPAEVPAPRGLRALVVSPRVPDAPRRILGVAHALAGLEGGSDAARVAVLRPPTLRALREELVAAREEGDAYHLLHLDAPLQVRTEDDRWRRGVVLEGSGELVTAEDLAEAFGETQVPVLVLHAEGIEPAQAFAADLLSAGQDVVISLGRALHRDATGAFCRFLHRGLRDGQSVARAVATGRRRLKDAGARPSARGPRELEDWHVPVLHARRELSFGKADAPVAPVESGEKSSSSLRACGRFVGRDAELTELETLLGATRVALIQGPAGIGKTELAKALGRWLVASGWLSEDRVFFHSFRGHAFGGDLDALLAPIVRSLLGPRFMERSRGTRRDAVRAALRSRPVLLCWDGLDRIPATADDLREQLRDLVTDVVHDGQALLLGTSRNPEEWLGMGLARVEVGGLHGWDAAELAQAFVPDTPQARARRDSAAFGVLLEQLGGHPLAIRLALPLLAREDAAEMLLRLRADGASDESEIDLPAQLEACLHHAFEQLSDDRARALPALSLFDGVVDVDVLGVFSGQPDMPKRFRGLDGEAWKSIVAAARRAGFVSEGELGLHELSRAVGDFLRSAWKEDAGDAFEVERHASIAAAIRAHAALADWVGQELRGSGASAALSVVAQQRHDLVRFCRSALRHDMPGEARVLFEPLACYWSAAGAADEAVSCLEPLIDALQQEASGVPELESLAGAAWLRFAEERAVQLLASGRLKRALQEAEVVAPALESRDDVRSRARLVRVRRCLAEAAERLGDLDRAEQVGREALRGAEELDDRAALAECHHVLAAVARRRGAVDDAEQWALKALAASQELEDQPGVVEAFHRLAVAADARDATDAAGRWAGESLAAAEQWGDPSALARAHRLVGAVAQSAGELDSAIDHYEQALAADESAGQHWDAAGTCQRLARAWRSRGDHGEAEDWGRRELARRKGLGDRPGVAQACHVLGSIARSAGDLDSAERWFERTLGVAEELGNLQWTATSHRELGAVARERGDFDGAASRLRRALDLLQQLDYQRGLGLACREFGELEEARGEAPAALDWAVRSLRLLGGKGDAVASRALLGRLAERLGMEAVERAWQDANGDSMPDDIRSELGS